MIHYLYFLIFVLFGVILFLGIKTSNSVIWQNNKRPPCYIISDNKIGLYGVDPNYVNARKQYLNGGNYAILHTRFNDRCRGFVYDKI